MHGLPLTLALWASLTQLLHSLMPVFKAQISQKLNAEMEFLNFFSLLRPYCLQIQSVIFNGMGMSNF